MTVDRSNVNFVRVRLLDFLLHLVLRGKRLVADVDVVFEGEGELSVLEIVSLH